MIERCDIKGRSFKVSFRKEPVYYMCELPKGHSGKHKIFVGKEGEEEW